MTGFGRAAVEITGLAATVEVRTVNHRHLDAAVRLPRMLTGLEQPVRKAAQEPFLRGKIDCSIQLGADNRSQSTVEIDRVLVESYAEFAKEWAVESGTDATLSPAVLLGLPGVAKLVDATVDEAEALPLVLAAVKEACLAALAMREAEGRSIEADLRARLDKIEVLAQEVAGNAGTVADAVRERLRKRAQQLQEENGMVDEARLQQELVMAADRLDVTEEVVRLNSHVEQFRSALEATDSGEPVGRRLDFLVQEMGREANTIGSKSGGASVSHLAVDLKTELERIREQVQNVE